MILFACTIAFDFVIHFMLIHSIFMNLCLLMFLFYRRFNYGHVMSFTASSNGPSKFIKCMSYGELEDKVYVCFDTGQFVVYSDIMDIGSMPTINDYPGNEEPVCCMTALQNVRRYESF